MMIPYITTQMSKEAFQERADLEEFANKVAAASGAEWDAAFEFACSINPSHRRDAMLMIFDGFTFDQVSHIFSDTTLSALWRLNLAGRELVRAIVGARSVFEPLDL